MDTAKPRQLDAELDVAEQHHVEGFRCKLYITRLLAASQEFEGAQRAVPWPCFPRASWQAAVVDLLQLGMHGLTVGIPEAPGQRMQLTWLGMEFNELAGNIQKCLGKLVQLSNSGSGSNKLTVASQSLLASCWGLPSSAWA